MDEQKIKGLENAIQGQFGNIVGLLVQKNGEREYEKCFNGFAATDAVHVYSVTKSIFSALVGIAIEKGAIKSVGQRVLEFFPEHAARPGADSIHDVTIENLLTMTAPYRCDAEPYEAFFTSGNWVEFALGLLGGGKPAGAFRYSPIVGTHILGGILARATRRPVGAFAAEFLFEPLGIPAPGNVVFHTAEEQFAWYRQGKHPREWVADGQGVNTAGWGLALRPDDLAKIGQLYLNEGVWEGRRLLPADWVRASTSPHARWNGRPYGYLWWLIDEGEHSFAGLGDGGNVLYVNPAKKLVTVITALMGGEEADRIEWIRRHVEPLFDE